MTNSLRSLSLSTLLGCAPIRLGVLVVLLSAGPASPALAGPACDCGDNDGIPDVMDNCVNTNNPAQCDADHDGYGNACDGDFDQSLIVDATDFTGFFVPDFTTGTDGGTGTDMNCSGTVDATDFTGAFVQQFTAGVPGPSGLTCAGNVPCP